MTRTRSRRVRPPAPSSPLPAAAPGPDRRRLRVALALAVFVVVFVSLQVGSYTRTAATFDEPIHLADGYVSAARADFRIDPEHPPLLRMWAAVPLLVGPTVKADLTKIEATSPTRWAFSELFLFAHQFMYRDNDADALLYRARFMMVLLGAGLGCLLFWWLYEWYGFAIAAFGLVLFTAEPNLAAHSALVTTDFGVTCLIFAAIFFLQRALRTGTMVNVAATAVMVGLAVISKFSGLLVGPMILILLAVATVWGRQISIGRAAGWVALFAVTSVVFIWAAYGFRYAPSGSPEWRYRFHQETFIQAPLPTMAKAIGWIDDHHLLPNVYSEGFLLAQAKASGRKAFFAGEYGSGGWWSYFPTAFAIKTPVALIALAIAGLVLHWQRRRVAPIGRAWFLLVPILVYGGSAMTTHINIGLRHILPVYPFIIVLAAEPLDWLWRNGRRAVLIAALVACSLEFGSVYPDNLAFFNVLIGGPGNGSKYLVDSNLDWGQDLKPLKRWMTEHNVPQINLAYFGFADPRYYGIECTFLPGSPVWVHPDLITTPRLPGYVAVSATAMTGVYADTPELRGFYAPLAQQTPVATIGHSIQVYWVERQWW